MDVKWNQPYQTGWKQNPGETRGFMKKIRSLFVDWWKSQTLFFFSSATFWKWNPIWRLGTFEVHVDFPLWSSSVASRARKNIPFPFQVYESFCWNKLLVGDFLNTIQNMQCFTWVLHDASFKADSNHIQTSKVKAKTKAFSLTKTKSWTCFRHFFNEV